VGKVFGKKKFCHLSTHDEPTCQATLMPIVTHTSSHLSDSGATCTPFLYYKRYMGRCHVGHGTCPLHSPPRLRKIAF